MATIAWNVKNANNRDVERQHLNKILADINASVEALTADRASTGDNASNVKAQVGEMVSGNTETGISVDYDPVRQVLDFVLANFTIRLTGDVSGSAQVRGLSDVTIPVTLASQNQSIGEAPQDGSPYWRRDGTWEQVPDMLRFLADIEPEDADILEWDAAVSMWIPKKDPRELYLDGGNF